MYNNILFRISLLVLIIMNLSFRWPVNQGKITSTFGESRGDHFHDGVDLVALDSKVYPITDGKLLYTWNRTLFPLDAYPGSGNYSIVEHDNGATEKIYSVYFHLDDSGFIADNYTKNDVLGNFANTGRSYGKHIHFGILNSLDWSSINALSLLPKYEDKIAPEIGNFALNIDGSYTILKENSNIRLTKHYPMLVQVIDTITGGEKLGVYHLKVMFNNKKVLDVKFDKMRYSNKNLTFTGKNFYELYDANGYYKISNLQYQQGDNSFKIIASDYAGNTSEKMFKLNINLDM